MLLLSSLFYLQNLFAAQITSFLRIIYPFVCLKLSTFGEKTKEVFVLSPYNSTNKRGFHR